ncbi:MAG: potassium transporter Kup [Proteobacteria bacterium]|nr:potassium transporter Kup [Pseudomonadota bacterium]
MDNKNPAAHAGFLALTVGAMGVVYGDIGTSPLYAFRESMAALAAQGGDITDAAILGIASLVIWSLLFVVTFKYVVLVLRADNHGEGGVLSLMTLARQKRPGSHILLLGMAGAALFLGDAMITPAISVLSAVEGLKLATDTLTPYILPIATLIIIALFMLQARGTEHITRYFGPIMVLWFSALGLGGLVHLADTPKIWQAFNPTYGAELLAQHGSSSFIILAAVFLTVTGAEALYADLGHFGKKPIRAAWLGLVMPSLALNYLGQAAMVLSHPETAESPFFLLYPGWALLPMVGLATCATVIAGQAVITGAYSMTRQAIQLSLLPRMHVNFTSATQMGQIYIAKINWLVLAGVLLLIMAFRSSENLAAAYGIAVTGTMVITTLLLTVVMRHVWRWPLALMLLVIAPFFIIDMVFLAANLTKLAQGGFLPLLFSAGMMLLMHVWWRGSCELARQVREQHLTVDGLMTELCHRPPRRITGTAIFLTSDMQYAPSALLQNLKHNQVLHDHNILLTMCFENEPYITGERQVRVQSLNADFTRIYLHYGYMQQPNLSRSLAQLRAHNVKLDMMHTSFFISRRNIMPSAKFGMPLWKDRIFIAMYNSASDAADYFHIPPSRVVELGVQTTV